MMIYLRNRMVDMFVQMNYENFLYFFVFSTDYFDCLIHPPLDTGYWIPSSSSIVVVVHFLISQKHNFQKTGVEVSTHLVSSFNGSIQSWSGMKRYSSFITDTIDKYCRTVIRFTLRANFVVTSPRFLRVQHECDV